MIFVLSCMDFSFFTPEHKYLTSGGKEQDIVTAETCVFYTKEIRESVPKLRNDILITQRFYDPKDRYEYNEEDTSISNEKDAT